MATYVITPAAAIRLAESKATIPEEHKLLAPSAIRTQVLSLLYQAARAGDLTQARATEHLTYLRGLRLRLLGDRVLQRTAWKVADTLGWPDTIDAEYVALTQLHADALITIDDTFAAAVRDLVPVVSLDVLGDAATPEGT